MSNIGVLSVIGNRFTDFLPTLFQKPEPIIKKDVVVIGYGWGGKAFCDKIDTNKFNVTVVSKYEGQRMLNTPKLKNHVLNDGKSLDELFVKNKKVLNFINEESLDVDKINSIVKTKNHNLNFDYLIVAVGSEVNDFGIPGVKDNCYFLKTAEDLYALKKSILENKFKNNNEGMYGPNENNIAILGGGPVGIELAFQLSKKLGHINVIEASPNFLPMFSYNTREMVKTELDKAGILLYLNNQVTKILPNEIKIMDTKRNMETSAYYNWAIWTCGIKRSPFIDKLTNGNFVVDSNLKWKNNIYAIGDVTMISGRGPPTAQNAKQQGHYLAKYFNDDFKGKKYKYAEKGKLIHTKDWIIAETTLGSFRLPYILEPVLDYLVEN